MSFFKKNTQNNNTIEQLETITGERGIPSINAKKPVPKKQLVFFCLIILVIGLGYAYLSMTKNDKTPKKTATQLTEKNTSRTFTFPEAEIEKETPQRLETNSQNTPYLVEDEKPTLNKSLGSVMISNANTSGTSRVEAEQSNSANYPISNDDSNLTATYTPSARAQRIDNRDFIIAKGAFINCGLQTRLDTTVQGMLACRVTENIYSDNGNFVLIERGSTVTGEYRSEVEKGKNRIYVLWNRIKTPRGIIININSPASDSLGGAGIDGYVDNHFWKRFGGAILMSLIDDANQVVINRTNKNNNSTLSLDSTANSTSELAAEILKNSINISPTLYRNQGDKVGIFVARDLNFSGVYRAKIK